jgi:lipoprotein-anchoring transpeptidase ErfK/SrfK
MRRRWFIALAASFIAAPAYADDGPVRIVVSLAEQRIYVYRNGAQIASSMISTGRKGYRTPRGTFTILEKKVHHRSSKYNNAPMPYMQRLTWSGYALHGGFVTGRPASHGCIRLPWGFARELFEMTRIGTTVVIK